MSFLAFGEETMLVRIQRGIDRLYNGQLKKNDQEKVRQ